MDSVQVKNGVSFPVWVRLQSDLSGAPPVAVTSGCDQRESLGESRTHTKESASLRLP